MRGQDARHGRRRGAGRSDLAEALVPFARRATITNILGRGRFAATRLDKQKIREPFVSPPDALLARALVALVQCAIGDAGENGYGSLDEKVGRAIVLTLHALGRDDWTAWTASWLMGYQDTPYAVRSLGDRVRLLLPSDHPLQVPAHERDDLTLSHSDQYHASNLADLDEGRPVNCYVGLSRDPATLELHVKLTDGEAYASRSLRAYTKVLSALATVGTSSEGAECGEPLYQAVPEPRRVALARHIVRYHRQAFDFVIVDEVHELTADNSAQARAGHRLTGMRLPTIVMTGSVMNGYAESLYNTMWAVSSDFRSEFDHDDRQRFIDRFGYRKRMVEDRIDGKVVEFGSHSDRVVRSERVIGNAPGVLPVFVLRHLLPVSVTLHKTDLALDLPECKQFRYVVEPTADQRRSYQKLRDALVAQIKSDMFAEDLSGKLFGQLAELPSYLDRATRDVGNCESGDYVICYPESVGGDVVATAPGLEPDVILPKEEWLLRTVQEELEAGRNVMVFSWHLGLLPRLARLLEERTGEKAPILYADKVPTAKRQGWIRSRDRPEATAAARHQPGLHPDGAQQPGPLRERMLDGEPGLLAVHPAAGHRTRGPHRAEGRRHADPLPHLRGHASGRPLRPAHEEGRGQLGDGRARRDTCHGGRRPRRVGHARRHEHRQAALAQDDGRRGMRCTSCGGQIAPGSELFSRTLCMYCRIRAEERNSPQETDEARERRFEIQSIQATLFYARPEGDQRRLLEERLFQLGAFGVTA